MQFVIVLLIAAAVFGVCYLVDKGFSRAFRGKAQHRSAWPSGRTSASACSAWC